MNKYTNSTMAREELTKGELELFPIKEEQTEYEKLILTSKTKSELIRKMTAAEYSKFTQGFIIGHLITKDNQTITKRTWIPTIFKK